MADELKPGDVVWLRSGGPAMTVEAVGALLARCIWFPKPMATLFGYSSDPRPMREEIALAALEHFDPEAYRRRAQKALGSIFDPGHLTTGVQRSCVVIDADPADRPEKPPQADAPAEDRPVRFREFL